MNYVHNGNLLVRRDAVKDFASYSSSLFHSNVSRLGPDWVQRNKSVMDAYCVSITEMTVKELRVAVKKLKFYSVAIHDEIPLFLSFDCIIYLWIYKCKYP